MATNTDTDFERCVIIINPVSTHAVPVKRRVAALQKQFPEKTFHIIETSPEGRTANQHLLVKNQKLLGPKTLLCIAAGDGTVNMFAEGLALQPGLSNAARQSVLLPLWGGNANDLAYMLNGRPPFGSITPLLERGGVVEIRPLECTFGYADGRVETRIAVCYASFGATAHATRDMAKESHRNHPLRRLHVSRLLFELVTGYRAFSNAPVFPITEDTGRKAIHELMIINGPRYAKIGRTPARLQGDSFFMHYIENFRPISSAILVIKVSQPKFAKKLLRKEAAFTIEEATLGQLDGELMHIPARTAVHIRLADKPLRMLSTRLT